jgi:plasmid stabilization system protein ParE
MPKSVRVSEPALQWVEQQAERIAFDFGDKAAEEFRKNFFEALDNHEQFPGIAKRGKIPGSTNLTIARRTIITVVERDDELFVAAARSHWQEDSHDPHEVYNELDEPEEPSAAASQVSSQIRMLPGSSPSSPARALTSSRMVSPIRM